MQRERVVALAPAVPDPRESIHYERVHADPPERGRKRQSGLAAAGDQHRGFAVGIFLAGGALFLPVGSAEVARKGFAGRPALADFFLEAFQFVQAGLEFWRYFNHQDRATLLTQEGEFRWAMNNR